MADDVSEALDLVLKEPQRVLEALAFVEALRQLVVITSTLGPVSLTDAAGANNCVIDLRGLTASGAVAGSSLPVTSTSGLVLVSTGTGGEWYPSA